MVSRNTLVGASIPLTSYNTCNGPYISFSAQKKLDPALIPAENASAGADSGDSTKDAPQSVASLNASCQN